MANALVMDGLVYAVAPTIGNILNMNSLRVRTPNFKWPYNQNGTFHSQGAASTPSREFSVYVSNSNVAVVVGGTANQLGTYDAIFGSGTDLDGELDYTLDVQNSTFTLSVGGVTYVNAAAITIGTGRIDGMSLRIGARSDDDTAGSTTGAFIAPSGAQFGDVYIYINGSATPTRSYIAPTTGTTWPENTNNQDATLYGGTPNWTTIATGSVLNIQNTNSLPASGNVQVYVHQVADKSIYWEGVVAFTDGAASIDLSAEGFSDGDVVQWSMIDPTAELASAAQQSLE